MENLNSRSVREKARVFDVEERDDCLILSKRVAPVSKRAMPSLVGAIFLMICGWHKSQESSVSGLDWWAVTAFILVGLTMLIVPIWEILGAHRGDVWVFDGANQQIKHSGLLIMSLKRLETVKLQRITDSENPHSFNLSIVSKKGQIELLDRYGLETEYLEVGQRIAAFAQIPFVQQE